MSAVEEVLTLGEGALPVTSVDRAAEVYLLVHSEMARAVALLCVYCARGDSRARNDLRMLGDVFCFVKR